MLIYFYYVFFGREGVPRDQTRALGLYSFICPWDFIIMFFSILIFIFFVYLPLGLFLIFFLFLFVLLFNNVFFVLSEGVPRDQTRALVFLFICTWDIFLFFLFSFIFLFYFLFFLVWEGRGGPQEPGPLGTQVPRSPGS